MIKKLSVSPLVLAIMLLVMSAAGVVNLAQKSDYPQEAKELIAESQARKAALEEAKAEKTRKLEAEIAQLSVSEVLALPDEKKQVAFTYYLKMFLWVMGFVVMTLGVLLFVTGSFRKSKG
ncbi:hypothetical protein ABXZ88_003283 [Vibrio fluvialis]